MSGRMGWSVEWIHWKRWWNDWFLPFRKRMDFLVRLAPLFHFFPLFPPSSSFSALPWLLFGFFFFFFLSSHERIDKGLTSKIFIFIFDLFVDRGREGRGFRKGLHIKRVWANNLSLPPANFFPFILLLLFCFPYSWLFASQKKKGKNRRTEEKKKKFQDESPQEGPSQSHHPRRQWVGFLPSFHPSIHPFV